MDAPLLAVGDGALGLWAALDGVFPTTAHQRCWNHRTLNVQARLPKSLHSEVRKRLREMSYAPTRSECERLRDEYVVDLSAEGRIDAAETVVRDWESFVSFYDLYVVITPRIGQSVGWARGARRIRLGELRDIPRLHRGEVRHPSRRACGSERIQGH